MIKAGSIIYLWLAATLLCASLATAQPGQAICRIEDGKFYIQLDKRWKADTKREIVAQYMLDSAMVAAILSGNAPAHVKMNQEDWKVRKVDANIFEIAKVLSESPAGEDWGKVWISDPTENTIGYGPGYVAPGSVVFGYNQHKKPAISVKAPGRVRIELQNRQKASSAVITGSFNNWSTDGIPMQQTRDGWSVELELQPGKYFYKFIVDGRWLPDPGNNQRERDGYGSYNSVLYVPNRTFTLRGYPKAKSVVLSGSFNGWNRKEPVMERTADGWECNVFLGEGTHTYKFLVDGNWISDPDNANRLADGYGGFNSVIEEGEPTIFALKGYGNARQVYLSGNFNDWKENELPMQKTTTGWVLPYVLRTGNYEYKYVVDGSWITDPSNPYRIQHGDYENSFVAVNPNHTFRVSGFDASSKVIITGTFSFWSHHNNLMVRTGQEWIFPMFLLPGKHQYKLIVNGDWITDPSNPHYEDNEFGTGNSVLWIEYPGLGQ